MIAYTAHLFQHIREVVYVMEVVETEGLMAVEPYLLMSATRLHPASFASPTPRA